MLRRVLENYQFSSDLKAFFIDEDEETGKWVLSLALIPDKVNKDVLCKIAGDLRLEMSFTNELAIFRSR